MSQKFGGEVRGSVLGISREDYREVAFLGRGVDNDFLGVSHARHAIVATSPCFIHPWAYDPLPWFEVWQVAATFAEAQLSSQMNDEA